MKIVDEKGKIFGKLNIIDLLVILVLIAAVVLVGIKLQRRDGAGNVPRTVLTYTVKVPSVEPQVYEEIQKWVGDGQPGDQLMANGAMVDAYVTAVEAIPHVNYGVDDQGQAIVSVEQDGRLDVTFTIRATIINPVTSEVGTQEVRVGKIHIVKTTHFELINGTILTCDWQPLVEG